MIVKRKNEEAQEHRDACYRSFPLSEDEACTKSLHPQCPGSKKEDKFVCVCLCWHISIGTMAVPRSEALSDSKIKVDLVRKSHRASFRKDEKVPDASVVQAAPLLQVCKDLCLQWLCVRVCLVHQSQKMQKVWLTESGGGHFTASLRIGFIQEI